MHAPVDWLLAAEPFVEHRCRLDLLGQSESDPAVQSARRSMLAHPRVVALVEELAGWPGKVVASHKSAGQPFHKLTFIGDLGLTAEDDGVETIVCSILARQSPEGPFQLPMNIPASRGGTGKEVGAWALCDAPLVVYGLAKLGLTHHPAVTAAIAHLTELVRVNGWPCAVSKELGGWRGPGRKDDPCPFANLAMLKALTQFSDLIDSPASRAGAETLLSLWADSKSRHPYIFYMGTDFRKIKAPFIWYDLLHVLDVLTQFPWLLGDPRLEEMAGTLAQKADGSGCFTPESVWMPWRAWEFGQKKQPSAWITLLAWRILERVNAR